MGIWWFFFMFQVTLFFPEWNKPAAAGPAAAGPQRVRGGRAMARCVASHHQSGKYLGLLRLLRKISIT